jgi:hypothetical protein
MKQVPVNIKVQFGKSVVKLETHESRAKTTEGVEIYLKMRPANEVQPIAVIPDGTLEQYKNCRPQIVSCEWVAA